MDAIPLSAAVERVYTEIDVFHQAFPDVTPDIPGAALQIVRQVVDENHESAPSVRTKSKEYAK
jgi:hypothetical protein